MKFMRVVNNTATEELIPVPGFAISQCFHPDIVAQIQTVNDDVQIGWVKQEDGSFADPNAASIPEPEPSEPAPE